MGYVPKQKAFRLEGGQGKKWSKIEPPKGNESPIIATSDRKTNILVEDIGLKMNVEVRKFGGSGRKVVLFHILDKLSHNWKY